MPSLMAARSVSTSTLCQAQPLCADRTVKFVAVSLLENETDQILSHLFTTTSAGSRDAASRPRSAFVSALALANAED